MVNKGVKIGNRTYMSELAKDPAYQKLVLKWESFTYNKFSDLRQQIEWSVMEAYLWEKIDIQYVGTTGVEYPHLPEDIEKAKRIVDAAVFARKLSSKFNIPPMKKGIRIYLAELADALEKFLTENSFEDADIAGDLFLKRAVWDTVDELLDQEVSM